MKKYFISSMIAALLSPIALAADTPLTNPFGPNVIIFDSTMSAADINRKIEAIYDQQRHNEFGEQRYAFLFSPGKYGATENVDVRVGYYTQVLGLGRIPEDVTILGAVRTQDETPGSINNYWRSAENLAIQPTLGSLTDPSIPKEQNVWAVAKSAGLRRVRIIEGSLRLYDVSYSNGGYLADIRVDKTLIPGSQSVWFMRNGNFGLWDGKSIATFVGIFGTIPFGAWPNPPFTHIDKTPLIREKPYLFFDKVTNDYAVSLRTRRRNVAGTDWHIAGTTIPISNFYIAKPGVTVSDLNSALEQGKHLFFTPGIYHLSDSIHITKTNTMLFGIGFPTLVNDTDKPAILVDDLESVHIAGLMFDAGAGNAAALLQVGSEVNTKTHTDPVYLYDVLCRIGGVSQYAGKAKTCVTINSNDVVVDNTWLWRADHGSNTGWSNNTSENGLLVNGKNVIVYNLTSDNHQKYQVNWLGDNGSVYHFVSDLPLDVPSQDVWKDGLLNGYAAFKIGDNVASHQLRSSVIYSHFQNPIWLDSGILTPAGSTVEHVIGFWSGNTSSGIKHMINSLGCGVDALNQTCLENGV